MILIESIKEQIAFRQLKKESRTLNRVRKNPGFTNCSGIGILYDATERETFELVRELYKDLKESGKKPVSLGYVDYNEALAFHPLARPECDYFFKNQLNWLGKPDGAVVNNFLEENFDMLILLTLSDSLPLDSIAVQSKAGVKIGRAESAVSFAFDMTLKIDSSADLRSFAYTIIHYLSSINAEQVTTERYRSSHYYTI